MLAVAHQEFFESFWQYRVDKAAWSSCTRWSHRPGADWRCGIDHAVELAYESGSLCDSVVQTRTHCKLVKQITLKAIPALLAGCTCVLKPSELSPLSSLLFAEFVHDAGRAASCFEAAFSSLWDSNFLAKTSWLLKPPIIQACLLVFSTSLMATVTVLAIACSQPQHQNTWLSSNITFADLFTPMSKWFLSLAPLVPAKQSPGPPPTL
jgi:hypothetical protein